MYYIQFTWTRVYLSFKCTGMFNEIQCRLTLLMSMGVLLQHVNTVGVNVQAELHAASVIQDTQETGVMVMSFCYILFLKKLGSPLNFNLRFKKINSSPLYTLFGGGINLHDNRLWMVLLAIYRISKVVCNIFLFRFNISNNCSTNDKTHNNDVHCKKHNCYNRHDVDHKSRKKTVNQKEINTMTLYELLLLLNISIEYKLEFTQK